MDHEVARAPADAPPSCDLQCGRLFDLWATRRAGRGRVPRRPVPAFALAPGDAAYVADLAKNHGTDLGPFDGRGTAACACSLWTLYSGSKLGIATTPFAPETKSAGTEFFVCFQIDSER